MQKDIFVAGSGCRDLTGCAANKHLPISELDTVHCTAIHGKNSFEQNWCSSDMIAAGTTSTNCTARNSSSRTVYFRQGRFFVISITQRTSHGLIFTRYYTSGRFEVKEDLQWVNRPVEAAHSAGDSCGDAASKAASGGGAEGLQEGCSEAHTAGEESSADERGCHADEILEDGNGRTLHDVLKPPTHQQPRRQMPDPRLYSRCCPSPAPPGMHVARACTSQQHSGGDTVKAYCQRLGLKLKTSLQQALNFIANFFFLLTQRLHASGSGCVEEAQQGVSGDDVLPGVHHEVVSSDPLTKPCPAPGYHPIAVNITAFGWPWGLDVLSTQVLV